MFQDVDYLDIYIQLFNLYNNYFNYLIIYFLNIIIIFYLKLDQDSKNFLFNWITFDFFNMDKKNNSDFLNKKMFKNKLIVLKGVKPKVLIVNSSKINLFLRKKRIARYYIKQSIFCRVNNLFNILSINKKFFFNINFRYFKFIYNLYLNLYDLDFYYKWIHIVLDKYNELYNVYLTYNMDYTTVFNNNYIFYPNNVLININFKLSNTKGYNLESIYNIEKYLFRVINKAKKKNLLDRPL